MRQPTDAQVQQIIETLQEKKALDVLLMDLRALTDTADFFILCSGTSDQHVRTLADELAEKLKAAGHPPWHIEGYSKRRWVLIDCVDIVVHIFRQEAREFYALERLWGDAKCTSFGDTWEDSEEGLTRAGQEDDSDLVFSRSRCPYKP